MPQPAAMGRRYAAISDLGAGLSPRHFLASPPQLLEDRQSSGVCPLPKSHRCEDTGFPNECCPDTEFCFVDKDFKSGCCAIGNNCASVNICTDTAFFYCLTTSTITAVTTSSTRSVSRSSTTPSITSAPNPNTTVLPACCRRPCSATSAYQCPSSLGGVCCSLGATCISNGCVATLPPAPSTTGSSIPSCATSNVPCTDGLGGCCNSGAHCTMLQSTGYCASGSAAPTELRIGGNPGDEIVEKPHSGLSTGAKAGIGAGAAIGALLVIGAAVWWWISRRRQASGSAPQGSKQGSKQGSGPRGSARGGTETVVSMKQGSTPGGPDMVGRGTEDYFGPAAGVGPFTGAEGAGMSRSAAVPLSPDQPGDIQPAVEIGEALGRRTPVSPSAASTRHEYWRHGAKTVNDRVELE